MYLTIGPAVLLISEVWLELDVDQPLATQIRTTTKR